MVVTTFDAQSWRERWEGTEPGDKARPLLLAELVNALAEMTPSGIVRTYCPGLYELVNLARFACDLPELDVPGLNTLRAKRKRHADRRGDEE